MSVSVCAGVGMTGSVLQSSYAGSGVSDSICQMCRLELGLCRRRYVDFDVCRAQCVGSGVCRFRRMSGLSCWAWYVVLDVSGFWLGVPKSASRTERAGLGQAASACRIQ